MEVRKVNDYWIKLAHQVIAGYELTKKEAIAILQTPDEEILALMQGAYEIRKHYFSNKVKLNMILSTKTGYCPENCGYCSQSIDSTAPIEKYTMMSKEEIIAGATKAKDLGVGTLCIVASGRGPTRHELNTITDAVKDIKSQDNGLKICACLGILRDGQAEQLKEAGVDRYNHNINTSASHHANITTSHTYDDRINTIEKIKDVHISPCSGVIVGMNESDDDVYEMSKAVRDLEIDSIPVNFLNPIEGTALADADNLTPMYCLKVLALFRYMNPSKEIRMSGGREENLRSLQALGLYVANAIFVGDYLTTEGQEVSSDHQMLEDLGFEVEAMTV